MTGGVGLFYRKCFPDQREGNADVGQIVGGQDEEVQRMVVHKILERDDGVGKEDQKDPEHIGGFHHGIAPEAHGGA